LRVKALLPLLVATTAAADPLELRPAPPPGAYPDLVASERACEADGDHAGLLRIARAHLAGHDVDVLHECGSTDLMSKLAIRTPGGWTLIEGATVAYQEANMTDAPAHVSLLDESVSTGSFENGAPALVYRATRLHRGIDTRSRKVAWQHRTTELLICTTSDDLRCARITYTCPPAGCVRPHFERGVLTTVEERDYRVSP
jgi:hypothetical protein